MSYDNGINLNLTLVLDYLGLVAPLVLLLISIFVLQNKVKYLQVYLVGFLLNNVLNDFSLERYFILYFEISSSKNFIISLY